MSGRAIPSAAAAQISADLGCSPLNPPCMPSLSPTNGRNRTGLHSLTASWGNASLCSPFVPLVTFLCCAEAQNCLLGANRPANATHVAAPAAAAAAAVPWSCRSPSTSSAPHGAASSHTALPWQLTRTCWSCWMRRGCLPTAPSPRAMHRRSCRCRSRVCRGCTTRKHQPSQRADAHEGERLRRWAVRWYCG